MDVPWPPFHLAFWTPSAGFLNHSQLHPSSIILFRFPYFIIILLGPVLPVFFSTLCVVSGIFYLCPPAAAPAAAPILARLENQNGMILHSMSKWFKKSCVVRMILSLDMMFTFSILAIPHLPCCEYHSGSMTIMTFQLLPRNKAATLQFILQISFSSVGALTLSFYVFYQTVLCSWHFFQRCFLWQQRYLGLRAWRPYKIVL